MITLKQLAELSGLSVRTVSRILTDKPNVRQDKRELVLKLAAEHHYVPNMAARNLRLQNRRFVGILTEHLSLNCFVQQLALLDRKLIRQGYYPILGGLDTCDMDHAIRMLREWAGTVCYVVVIHLWDENALRLLQKTAQELSLKLIFADCCPSGAENDLPVDRVNSICGMIGHLQKQGFRRILHCGRLPSRRDGLQLAAKTGRSGKLELLYLDAGSEQDDGFSAGPEIMKRKPEAVFFDTDRMAAGFYAYASQHGIRIPEDIAVIGFDDDVFAPLLTPPLSTMMHPHEELTEQICRIVTGGKKPDCSALTMRFMERGSSRRSK